MDGQHPRHHRRLRFGILAPFRNKRCRIDRHPARPRLQARRRPPHARCQRLSDQCSASNRHRDSNRGGEHDVWHALAHPDEFQCFRQRPDSSSRDDNSRRTFRLRIFDQSRRTVQHEPHASILKRRITRHRSVCASVGGSGCCRLSLCGRHCRVWRWLGTRVNRYSPKYHFQGNPDRDGDRG